MSSVKKQYLILPMPITYIEAGFKNPKYLSYWKYNHFGIDYTGKTRDVKENILSSGIGKVITAGKDSKVGNVLAIQYYNVYNHKTKTIQDVIARYMHMDVLKVKTGDLVDFGTVLGIMGNTGSREYSIHLHLEFDSDIKYPNNSGQVSGGSIFKAGTANSMINPSHLLHIGKLQKINSYTNSWYLSEDLNLPIAGITVFDIPISETTGQKLILPINKLYITASKGNVAYKQRFGFEHYGIDCISSVRNTSVYASGIGEVMDAGNDSLFGNTVVIKYENVYNHRTNKTHDVVFRYFHGASILVKKGQKVTKDTKIMIYGNTGKYSVGAHLHLSADTDTKYYNYEAGIASSGTVIKKGNSATMFNPFDVLYCKQSVPDYQTIAGDLSSKYNGSLYINKEDLNIPIIK